MKYANAIYGGGMLAGHRTYLVAGAGILSAFAAYMAGDLNVFDMLSNIFPLAAIYFLRKGLDDGK